MVYNILFDCKFQALIQLSLDQKNFAVLMQMVLEVLTVDLASCRLFCSV